MVVGMKDLSLNITYPEFFLQFLYSWEIGNLPAVSMISA
jgi:hypothetical protein